MSDTVSIPRFRTARRLIEWMERNWTRLDGERRLPREIEGVFFRTKKESPQDVARCVARYSSWTGKLEAEYEHLLKCDRDSVVTYIHNLKNKDQEVGDDLLYVLSGDSRNLYRAAKNVGRLPEDLETTISEPRYAFLYAKEVLRGRLPSSMESVFFGDSYHAAKYAFDVIRGFAPCHLPEELHTFMVMKSFEEPDNEHIKTYLQASESDPSRIGNSDERVK